MLITTRWSKTTARPLPVALKARLSAAIASSSSKNVPSYYKYCLRVAQYLRPLIQKDRDPLHSLRAQMCAKAIRRANRGLDSHSLSVLGRVANTFLPLMEEVFQMPGAGPQEGSPQWIQQQKRRILTCPFFMMTQHSELLKEHCRVQLQSKLTDSNGFPIQKDDEEVRCTVIDTEFICY